MSMLNHGRSGNFITFQHLALFDSFCPSMQLVTMKRIRVQKETCDASLMEKNTGCHIPGANLCLSPCLMVSRGLSWCSSLTSTLGPYKRSRVWVSIWRLLSCADQVCSCTIVCKIVRSTYLIVARCCLLWLDAAKRSRSVMFHQTREQN